jgi:hypothetical protein
VSQEIEMETAATTRTEPVALPPGAQIMQMLFGKHITYSLSAVARLGVADHIGKTPVSIDHLAQAVNAHAPSLYRVMRLLASLGVFQETVHGHFALTPVGELLRTDAPGSMRYPAIQFGDPWATRPFEYFTDCVRTGGEGVTMAWGKGIFDLFADIPEQAEAFHRSMTNVSGMEGAAILEAYDFSGVRRMADVGGGHGALLASIVQRNPDMHGVVYDLPAVVAGISRDQIGECGGRLEIEAGNFFERVPGGCDAYLLKHIIHDWDDDRSRRILKLIGSQLPPGGRVLVCEMMISDQPVPEMAKLLDIEMLVLTEGGRERTETEFRDLFASAGLRLNRIVRTRQPTCILEAVRA